MQIPFSIDQFLNVFKSYNQAVFPIQIFFYLTAFLCVYFLFKQTKFSGKVISLFLSFLWVWIGIVYHFIFFSKINPAAYIFGTLFIIQGLLFLIYGLVKGNNVFKYKKNIFNYIGFVFILYALIIYPILGHLFGHPYPYSPTFGLPCPTTIFTFGILLFIEQKIPIWLLFIPLLWSIVGFSAAVNLSIYEDLGLLLAGLLGFVLIIFSNRKVVTKFNAN